MLINHTVCVFFGESRNAPSPVRAKFRCRVGVGLPPSGGAAEFSRL